MEYPTPMAVLDDLLTTHDAAVRQIIMLDSYIMKLSRETYQSALNDRLTTAFKKMIYISVAEGVKRMYKEYRMKKWLQVQELGQSVSQIMSGQAHSNSVDFVMYDSSEEMDSEFDYDDDDDVFVPEGVIAGVNTVQEPQRLQPRMMMMMMPSDSVNNQQESNETGQNDAMDTDSVPMNFRPANQEFLPYPEYAHDGDDDDEEEDDWDGEEENFILQRPTLDDLAFEMADDRYRDANHQNLPGVFGPLINMDIEMGDQGIGHLMFDRASSSWSTSYCEFYRGN